mmetsp:Transcript_9766/g.17575  ORF Transcript_9766/g.17575 Transcript_9766/m.17575 type:complete len:1197 (-) Transcript_9766:45-3635(-)
MGNSKNNNGDKGTYGRISSSKDNKSKGGSNSNKKQPRRHSSGNVPPGRSSRVKTDYSGGATKSPSARKKSKTSNAAVMGGGATAKSASSSKKSSSSSSKNKKAAQDSKKKVPPKSKHHTAKPNRNSIKERVASAAAAAQKKSHNSSSSKITHNSTGAYKGAGRAARKEKKYMESKRRRGDSNKKKVRQQYRMTLSECNDDVYKQRSDVPWFDAAVQDRFFNSVAAFDPFASDDDSVEQGDAEGETLQMPSEQILQQIDAELHSFGVYVKLTPCERAARKAFLDHVTELAVLQFDTITVRGVTHPRTLDNYSSGRDNYFHLGAGGGGKGAATSLDDFEDSDDEEIHVAPFGSFATEEVCTFLSDVDMCLWGVVKGAKNPEKAELFIGNTGDDSDEGANAYDRAMALGNGSQCPLLTESALLRTMDAIQSAPKLVLQRPEDEFDARALDDFKAAVLEDLHRPNDGVNGANDAKVKQQNTDSKEHNGLFFIDRVGEGADDAKSVDVIDLSTNETSNGQATKAPNKEKAVPKGTASSAADFEFVIDSQGVKDLGGEVEDLTESPNAKQTSMEQADKIGVESPNEGAQKVEEFKMGELFVGGLPYEVTDVSFRQFFQQYGEVSDSFVSIERRTKKSRGFGFVTFADANVTASILTTIPGKTGMVNILGKECKVNVSERGLKKLSGEVKDLTESPDAEQTSTEQAGKASTIKSEVESTSEAAQKVDEENVEEGDFELPTFSALGKSAQDAIDINDDSSGDGKKEVIVVESDDDDDEDSADKMSSYYSREGGATLTPAKSEIAINAPASPIDLLDDSSSESSNEYQVDDSSDDESLPPKTLQTSSEVLELSLTSNNNSMARKPSAGTPNQVKKKQTIGPTGKTRVKVLSALQSLTRQLRRSSFTNTIECRSKARVPIINCGTRTGFEGDIAIGGHNGVDTSNYAMDQVNRFSSFASIVILLKILMAQQGFDKPFTGGLGSYKLYVLVAFHMERHIANGGSDRPSEVLISLLFRYGSIGKCHDEATSTDLERLQKREDPITCDGGMCDFVPMFRLSDCVDMFRECHARLFDRVDIVEDLSGDGEKISYLSSFIDCFRLREARDLSVRRSKLCDDICRPIERDHPGKVTPGRRIGKVFSAPKNDAQKRGPRGGLLPKKRPDLQAKNSLRSNREAELIQRGMKNRKNNKKQKRDAPGRSFAPRHSI